MRIFDPLGPFLRRLLPQNAFARRVSVLMTGTAGAQLLLVLASPLLTRLYTPADFGVFAVFSGLLSLLAIISCLGYENAIPLPPTDQEASSLLALCFILSAVIALGTLLGLVWLAGPITSAWGESQLGACLWLLPPGVAIAGCYSCLSYHALRSKKFRDLAATKIQQVMFSLAIQILGFKFGSLALCGGQLAAQGGGITRLIRVLGPWRRAPGMSLQKVLGVASRYRRFPLLFSWSALLQVGANQLIPVYMAIAFGPIPAGIFALANRILATPLAILGRTFGQVFFSDVSKIHRAGTLPHVLSIQTGWLMRIGAPPLVFFGLIAPELCALVFGESWRKTGEVVQVLVPPLLLQFVVSPFSSVLLACENQGKVLSFQILLCASRGLAVLFGSAHADFFLAVVLISVSSCLCYAILLFWIFEAAQIRFAPLIKMGWETGLATLIICLPALFLKLSSWGDSKPTPVLILSLFGAAALYFLFLKSKIGPRNPETQ